LKMVRQKYPNSNVFVFSRNAEEREFAKSLGAAWAGAIDETPPEELNAIIDTTPVLESDHGSVEASKARRQTHHHGIRKEEIDKRSY